MEERLLQQIERKLKEQEQHFLKTINQIMSKQLEKEKQLHQTIDQLGEKVFSLES